MHGSKPADVLSVALRIKSHVMDYGTAALVPPAHYHFLLLGAACFTTPLYICVYMCQYVCGSCFLQTGPILHSRAHTATTTLDVCNVI